MIRAARRVIRARIGTEMRPLAKTGPVDRAVGTSKTIRSLARIAGAAPSSEGPYAARSLERAALREVVARLSATSAAERAELPGVSPSRASQVLAGALVVEAAMDLLGVERLDICPWALREGVILQRLDIMG